jgi:amidohydrolase
MEYLLKNIESNKNNIIDLRRHFHQYPELSAEEFETQKKIFAELNSYGIKAEKCSTTGVVADINGMEGGKTIAIRADIDALPLMDEIDKQYKSKNVGVCHACGHDCHTASLLGIARAFNENRDKFKGRIRLLFQPSEEKSTGCGAVALIENGCLNNVDAIIGAHVWQPIEVGKVAITKYMMASVGTFKIKIIGKGGHGSQPQLCISAINVGTQIINALNTITSCGIDPREMAVLSIGRFQSGIASNVIPEIAIIEGSTRCFSKEIMKDIENKVKDISTKISEINGAKCEVDFDISALATINDDNVLNIAKNVIDKTIGAENRIDMKPNLGGEDFSYYLEKIPGLFVFVGAYNKDKQTEYGHHNPKFDVDEDCIINTVKILSSIAMELLNNY